MNALRTIHLHHFPSSSFVALNVIYRTKCCAVKSITSINSMECSLIDFVLFHGMCQLCQTFKFWPMPFSVWFPISIISFSGDGVQGAQSFNIISLCRRSFSFL